MNKLYTFLLVALCLTSCTRAAYVHTEPAFYYITDASVPMYSSLAPTAPPTNVAARDEQMTVVGRVDPSWLVVKRSKRIYYIKASQLSTVRPAVVASPTPTSTTGSGSGRRGSYHPIQTGPRGGKYYINGNGNKTYIRRK